ncbi:CoA transferase [Nocardia sp. AG03]|uniref:CoA transferase n=1 Tax=Nocardia sp. AG03 TaxID=3025312 RepID=UPI002418734D|nr:CoA transferase [Nocardia sp. AG03]
MTAARDLLHAYETGLGVSASDPADEPDPGARLAATLPVWALAAGSVGAVQAAANRLRATRGLPSVPVRLDPDRIAAAFSSERLFRHRDTVPQIFAALSGFFPTADGWIRTHANYPHHRDRLAGVLGLPVDATAEQARAALRTAEAAEIEAVAAAAGALAVRVRSETEWAESPMGRAAAEGALVTIERRDPAATGPRSDGDRPTPWPERHTPTASAPLRGLRVLDLTRVLAGPVATRTLALLGADVLRVDPPRLPEIDWQFLDTCQGKRSTLLDLGTDLAGFQTLLDAADVLVTGYRPGALARVGVGAAGRPGLIEASVSAWGVTGPWGDRRGFDSLVQATAGISILEGSADQPGALPAQALDHGSGYLLAAGVIDALAARAGDGLGRSVRVSLARTASWLLGAGGRDPNPPAPTAPSPSAAITHGPTTTAAPALADYDDYRWPAPPYGSAQPFWVDAADLRH